MELELTFNCDSCKRVDEQKPISISLDGWEGKYLQERMSELFNGDAFVEMKCPDCIKADKDAVIFKAKNYNSQLMDEGKDVTERMQLVWKRYPDLSYDLEIS